MAETLTEEVLGKMHAPPKPDVPIADVHDLPNADGFVFAFPTRYAATIDADSVDFTSGIGMALADTALLLLSSKPSWTPPASCGKQGLLLASPSPL